MEFAIFAAVAILSHFISAGIVGSLQSKFAKLQDLGGILSVILFFGLYFGGLGIYNHYNKSANMETTATKLTKQILEQNKLTFLRSEVIANNDTTLVQKIFTKELTTLECTSTLKDDIVSTNCKQTFKINQS
jgi:hypothetical protein